MKALALTRAKPGLRGCCLPGRLLGLQESVLKEMRNSCEIRESFIVSIKEVIAFVIGHDKGCHVFHTDFAYCLHSRSSKSTNSTDLMFSAARIAAGRQPNPDKTSIFLAGFNYRRLLLPFAIIISDPQGSGNAHINIHASCGGRAKTA